MNQKKFKSMLAAAKSREEKLSVLDAYAESFFEKEKYGEACRHWTQALEISRQPNIRAYFAGQVGICRYNAGDDNEALKYLLKSSRLFQPDEPEFMPDMYGFVHFHLGSLYEYYGKNAKSLEARRVCEQYSGSQEKDTRWMLYAGISRNYEALGKYDESIRYSQKAIQVLSNDDPGLAYLYESMGNNYMSLKQYPEAIKYFSKVLELDHSFPRRDDLYMKLGECHYRLTNHKMALDAYEKILELKLLTGKVRGLTWLYAKIAHCHFRLDQFEKSLLVTLEALRRHPRNKVEKAEIRAYLTINYFELGRFKEAVLEGEQTLKLARKFQNNSLFYFRMALSYRQLGDQKNFKKYRTLCRRMFDEDSWNRYLAKLD